MIIVATPIDLRINNVVVCTDLSDKAPHTQVGVGRMVLSGSLGGEMVNTLSRNARDVGSIPALGATFPIFIKTHDNSLLSKISKLIIFRYSFAIFVD